MRTQFKHKKQCESIDIPSDLRAQDLETLLAQVFDYAEKLVGVCDKNGRFLTLFNFLRQTKHSPPYTLVTRRDTTDENMSFGTATSTQQKTTLRRAPFKVVAQVHFLQIGIIGDLSLFQEICLLENTTTVIVCYAQDSPPQHLPHSYYACHTDKNCILVYSGTYKVCQFFPQTWGDVCYRKIHRFLKQIPDSGKVVQQQNSQSDEIKQGDIKESVLQNLNKLLEVDDINELQYYKLKSQVLQNPQDFIRKHQMGTRQGFRNKVHQGEQAVPRARKCQIPIIVRKYNNVVEKISTSYELTPSQQKAIDIILELEVKGLLYEGEAETLRTFALRKQEETLALFKEYFDHTLDQFQLAGRLKALMHTINRPEHQDRLVQKHAKQEHVESLRRLVSRKDKRIVKTIENYRQNKSTEQLENRLEKLGRVAKAEEQYEDINDQLAEIRPYWLFLQYNVQKAKWGKNYSLL